MNVLAALYPWLKAGHVIFVIFWMAGLFMLPRYYVYHQESESGSAEETAWLKRENALRRIILTPSMILTWILGILTATAIGAWSEGWLHTKLLFVLALSGYHGWLAAYGKKLARGERPLAGRKLRLLNEVPALLAVVIVILVVVKPF